MITLSAIHIGDRDWILPGLGLLALAAVLLWWAYQMRAATTRVRVLAAGLKATGLAILCICLVEPLWSGVRARPGANLFLLIADNSQSLQIRDEKRSRTRGDHLEAVLRQPERPDEQNWQVRLSQDFDVRRSVFDTALHPVEEFRDFTFDGTGTSLNAVLSTIRERYRDRPVGGILLFTDGNATDLDGTPLDLRDLPPVYPVMIGEEKSPRDIAIRSVAVTQSSFEDAPVALQADVTTSSYRDSEIVAQLFDPEGTLIEEQRTTIRDESLPVPFRFQVRPEKPGISFYRLRTAAAKELAQFDDPAAVREATLANNTRLIKIDHGHGPHRILYVGGRPNWEFKFLRRAVEEDEQIDLVGMIRVAKREPKFDFRGREDETSNPLFRGFKKQGDVETERYDEPVIVRLNTKDAAELRDGFPKTAEDLFGYAAVILDDLEAEFFTRNQMALVRRFVSQRGGGLLMLGGQESFRQGKFDRTPIGELLPVYIDRGPVLPPGMRYRMTLTRHGWLNPWVRLRSTEEEEHARLADMPEFRTLNTVSGIKPGATVLATAVDTSGRAHPALVVQRFGEGRCAALTIGDLWRWQLRSTDQNDDLGKAWRQTLRWLVADVPQRVEASIEPAPEVAAVALKLRIRTRDAEFQPLDNASVRVTVQSPDGQTLTLNAEPSLEEAGLYETVYVPRATGAYRASVAVTDADGQEVGTAETGWATDPAEQEFRSLAANRNLLQKLAQGTGGEIVPVDGLEDFVAGLPTRSMPITERWTFPLWDQPWVFLLAVGCLAGEWGLRRIKGLP